MFFQSFTLLYISKKGKSGRIMKKNTYQTIIFELNQTGQVSQKLLLSLSAPIVIKMFYNLFGPTGTHQLSENGYNKILSVLKETDDKLPNMPVPFASSTLTQLFYEKIGQHITGETGFEEDSENFEEITDDLVVDDLLDLLNFAKVDFDDEYADYIKNRLLQLCSISR